MAAVVVTAIGEIDRAFQRHAWNMVNFVYSQILGHNILQNVCFGVTVKKTDQQDLRWILVRLRGKFAGAYRDMCRQM
jgi:hypothetical protein